MKTSKTPAKLITGKDIILERDERLITYKSKINSTIFYSTNKYKSKIVDGKEFIAVFEKPLNPNDRKVKYIAESSLERVKFTTT